ncbi:MAG TPA: T9SS type A sorting domain-containing protein [Chitinophagaceae bacterium]|nr:T9SS type A sorting domain-containing protein [Chitinophagaceae bacterium]
MKKYVLLFLLVFSYSLCFSQNWKGISNSDTTFFIAATLPADSEWNGLLRCVWVESSSIIGSDSLFSFNRSIRESSTLCADTNADSWLGTSMIRTVNGIEYYNNSVGDSLEFHTWSNLSDTWKVISDSNGIDFYATVTNVYTTTIDGTLDSIKEMNLQAWQGATMIANYYNNMVIKLSKEHGFISIMQLEIFPYRTWADYYDVAFLHPALPYLHSRIGNSINIDFNHIDLTTKYSPGNEWIYEYSQGYGEYDNMPLSPEWFGTITTNHDSIINANLLSPTAIEYTFQRKQNILDKVNSYNTSTGLFTQSIGTANSISIITDTAYQSATSNYIHAKYCGDLFTLYNTLSVKPYHYFVDTVCSFLRLRSDSAQMPLWQRIGSCWQKWLPISSYTYYRTSQIADMGFQEGYIRSLGVMYQLTFNSSSKLHYLKTNTCTYLNKFNVLALNTSSNELTNELVKIYPNPAQDEINILLNDMSNSILSATVFDMSGATVLQTKSSSTQIDIHTLKSGIYFIELKTMKGKLISKIVK